MFTGAKLSDGNGGLLVSGEIKRILESNHKYPESLTDTNYYYWPFVTTLFQVEETKHMILWILRE